VYRRALSTPGALAFFLAAAPARLGLAMTGLGLVWLVHDLTGSYGRAGVVTGAFAITEALIGPQTARVIDRYGQTRVLPLLLAVHGAAIAGLLAGGPMIVLAVLAGATIPQVGALVAARWSHALGEDELLSTAFALESMASSVAFLAGPALVGTMATLADPRAGTALAAALVVAGGLALAAQTATAPRGAGPRQDAAPGDGAAPGDDAAPRRDDPPRDDAAPARDAAPRRGGLASRGFAGVVGANAALGMVFGALQVSVTAFATDHGAAGLAGPLYSVMNLACLASAALYGRRARTVKLRTALALLSLANLPLLVVNLPWQLAVALVAPGLAIAPILTLSSVVTQRRVDKAVLTQAYTWLNSASAAGLAGAAAAAGQLVDAADARAGFVLAVVAAACGAVAASGVR
jgi:MFS family permease